ncbi:SprT-like family-domain-containing protein [Dendryphion nanum]|uniref:SprT-like family-domain-containing protein n=1 Tax=Dendryphion nanum TaxID=256645 RepID=A0A9P9EIV5_9PLEO|nr:SprT-like family-domain-containing protein [Dendryphion nanum]
MARLRKASSPTEPFIEPPATTQRTRRTSPRKADPESPSKRELRYTWQDNAEDSFLVPKIPASLALSESPKKQRILRPVASNSRLLRKLSNESLATPDRKERIRPADRRTGLLYARSLARTVAKSKGNSGKEIPEKKIEQLFEETVLDENEDPDQSLWCGDEEDDVEDKKEAEAEVGKIEDDEVEDEDEDEDPIVDLRNRRRQPQRRIVESDSGSDSDEEDLPVTKLKDILLVEPTSKSIDDTLPTKSTVRQGDSAISNWAQDVVDLTSSPEAPSLSVIPGQTRMRTASFASSNRPTSSYSVDGPGIMQYIPTPTKLRSPRKAPPITRPSTPPLAPASPSKLVSPSKARIHIPTATNLRPSLDAFWNAELVNDHHDKHSPSKPLLSPKKQKWLDSLDKGLSYSDSDSDASISSPTNSPRKKKPTTTTNTSLSSPSKRAPSPTPAQLRTQRKAFSTTKHALATTFLTTLDTTITSGRIGTLTAPTGGIKLLWSKTLKTTAGRANWRRETIRIRTGPGPNDMRTEIRHHCSIELAEKVIDDAERLYNVLAHEYCHLTTFLISEVRNNPHGAEFKSWAAKVSHAFAHLDVQVTTKHSYEIAYKYVWRCVVCACEFKRHSKSVDPGRHSCGKCKGALVQVRPVPRGGAAGAGAGAGAGAAAKDGRLGVGGERKKSEYQVFVKEHFARVKREMGERGLETQMGKVMAELAREYREGKEKREREGVKKEVEDVELAFEGLKLGD